MINLIFSNSRKIAKRIIPFQKFSIFNRVKKELENKNKPQVEQEQKPKEELLVVERELNEYEQAKEDMDMAELEGEPLLIGDKQKKKKKGNEKILDPDIEKIQKLKGTIFSGKIKIKPIRDKYDFNREASNFDLLCRKGIEGGGKNERKISKG